MGDNMAYKNSVFRFVADYPIAAFFLVPIGIKVVGSAVRMVSNPNFAAWDTWHWDSMGNVVTEGGDGADMMFRATSNPQGPAPGTGTWETVMPSPTQQPVRYDPHYHDERWLFDPSIPEPAPRAVSQKGIATEYDTTIFAGVRGLEKLR